jgi:hypothetical protein
MKRGGKFLVSTTILAVAACGGQDGKLEIRSTPTPLAQGKRPVPFRIAEARGQLALGNTALALEAFRAAAREDPNSVDALAGIAACYDQMGRYDLSRRNYEAALALAPSDVTLLGAFAASLQMQGLDAEALSVRQEIATRTAAAALQAAPQQEVATIAPAPVVAAPSAFEEVRPAASAVVQVAAVERKFTVAPVEMVEPAPVPVKLDVSAPAIASSASVLQSVEVPKPAPQPVKVEQPKAATPAPVQTAALGPSVTIKLPPARPVKNAPAPAAAAIAPKATVRSPEPAAPQPSPSPTPVLLPVELANVAPVRRTVRPEPELSVVQDKAPRLERISMGEIGLITSAGPPVWKATTVARTDQSTRLRFVPLRQAYSQPVKVRLLNAARVNRLAARTRTWLNARGWRGLSIGNATATRTRSVILYPAGKRAFAQRLSAQFGFPLARRASGAHVTVLLGADAARHRAARSGRA